MNNQIRELKLQAGIQDNPDQEGLDLFAELIVQECIDYCGENLSKTVGGALKIHFGVKDTHHSNP